MSDEELRFNVLNHEIVPHHEALPEDQVQAILDKYGIVKEQLPKIKTTDPGVQVVFRTTGSTDPKDWVGRVIKVTRNSPTAGHFTAYRLVVEAI